MDDKYRLIFAAHEILTTQQGATALPTVGVVVRSTRSCGRSFLDWAIDMSKVGDAVGGWSRLVDAYLSDELFSQRQKNMAQSFWRLVRKRTGLYANGIFIAEKLGV